MAEIREIMDQLKRDAELWRLKFEQSVRYAKTLTAERDELAAANDGLEDTISELRAAIEAYQEQYLRNEWNVRKLHEIKMLAGSAL